MITILLYSIILLNVCGLITLISHKLQKKDISTVNSFLKGIYTGITLLISILTIIFILFIISINVSIIIYFVDIILRFLS